MLATLPRYRSDTGSVIFLPGVETHQPHGSAVTPLRPPRPGDDAEAAARAAEIERRVKHAMGEG